MSMERIIHLRGTTITLLEDRLSVEDGVKKNRMVWILAACSWTIYALLSIWKYTKTQENFHLWFGIISGILWLVVLHRWLFLSGKEQIALNEIKEAKFRSTVLGGESLDLKLKNGLRREILDITPAADELRRYFAERGL